ncbi:hypothetical protein A2Z67_02405 [Candidatus Woesebacteria bacterium RBG_13_36_22]|uniref:Uncharacterized protein n=1 Tax=Candidatus Woesebacteria bacterium RBG_13_36_22 TaxID=1802478 RepID=A0A1F7X182_9BACT|nr:MAG: hypothetical protein A2Z67_02405 [Candidatus Woesebacteria bacterium RBG_13_36_22]
MKLIITLSSGLRVGNFSSPYAFEFEDGTILPAIDDITAKLGTLDRDDEIVQIGKIYSTIHPVFKLNNMIEFELDQWINVFLDDKVDIVIVPLPVLQAMQSDKGWKSSILSLPFRTIYIVDRIKKIISINKFCI